MTRFEDFKEGFFDCFGGLINWGMLGFTVAYLLFLAIVCGGIILFLLYVLKI